VTALAALHLQLAARDLLVVDLVLGLAVLTDELHARSDGDNPTLDDMGADVRAPRPAAPGER